MQSICVSLGVSREKIRGRFTNHTCNELQRYEVQITMSISVRHHTVRFTTEEKERI